MKITNKNPRKIRPENHPKTTDIFRCKFCGQLQGCSESGEIGMYSYKILRQHELICAKRPI